MKIEASVDNLVSKRIDSPAQFNQTTNHARITLPLDPRWDCRSYVGAESGVAVYGFEHNSCLHPIRTNRVPNSLWWRSYRRLVPTYWIRTITINDHASGNWFRTSRILGLGHNHETLELEIQLSSGYLACRELLQW
jgi:hypothetical protein